MTFDQWWEANGQKGTKHPVVKKSFTTDLIPGVLVGFKPTQPHDAEGNRGGGVSRELIKAMAMDAGKSLCAYLEVMFPEVWHGQNSGFKISMKHHVYNDIMALADLHDEAAIRKRLAANEAHRKAWVGAYRKMRRKKCEHGIREHECGLCEDARRAKREKPTQPHERLGDKR